jgi:hypothetical protein
MQKPYTYAYLLSYNGIIQYKKFTKLRDYEAEKQKREASRQAKANKMENIKIVENKISEVNKKVEARYSLNKSKVRARAIAFSRLPKSRKNFYFFTISFPSQLPDNQCFKVLNTTLTRLRKDDLIKDYLWITERQKNSTLHYHILTNDIIQVKTFNSYVRASLKTIVRKREFSYDYSIIENYNGVDIAKNRKTKRVINFATQKDNRLIISYLTKYITKNTEQFTRLPFHSSHSISKLTNKVLIDEYTSEQIWQKYQQQNINPKTFLSDFCNVYFFSQDIDSEVFEIIDKRNIELYQHAKE